MKHVKTFKIIFLFFFSFALAAHAKGKIKFTFNPTANSTPYKKIKEKKITFNQGSIGNVITNEKWEISGECKKTKTGFEFKETILSIDVTAEGKSIESPQKALFEKTSTTYLTSPKGELLQVIGNESILKKVETKIPPNERTQEKRKLFLDQIFKKQKAEWKRKIQNFSGKSIKLDTYWRKKDGNFSDNDENYYSLVKFGKGPKVGEKQMIAISYAFSTEEKDLDSLISMAENDLYRAFKKNLTTSRQVSARSIGKIIIAPSTMLIQSEKLCQMHLYNTILNKKAYLDEAQIEEETNIYHY